MVWFAITFLFKYKSIPLTSVNSVHTHSECVMLHLLQLLYDAVGNSTCIRILAHSHARTVQMK